MGNKRALYIVLGTRAQFIKVAPLMRELLNQGISYTLIYTAQHKENIYEILDIYDLPAPHITLYNYSEANTKSSFLKWFIVILYKVLFRSRTYISESGVLLTHGDTFTAWLAAVMGKRSGCTVGHIESGLRSYNILSPFPEEISRMIIFNLSDIFFCADEWTMINLRRYKGIKVNIGANTMLDGVRYALNSPITTKYDFEDSPFALVSLHRFENIFTSRFVEVIIPILEEISKEHRLVFTLHPVTRERLLALGLLENLERHPNIILHERFGFVEWIKICSNANFVITDGGSNQEELSYLGVPTLLFRNETERQEGLGENIVLTKFNRGVINDFLKNIPQYKRNPLKIAAQPSKVIIKTICRLYGVAC